MAHTPGDQRTRGITRRAALRAGVAAGAVGAGLAASVSAPAAIRTVAAAQMSMRLEHLEVDAVPAGPVSIVAAGSGPPQRGDWFSISGPIYAVGDRSTPIGQYNCFGPWTAASTDMEPRYRRLTSVQFDLMDAGSIMGLINEDTPANDDWSSLVGAVQGGTGRYTGALGTFVQIRYFPEPGFHGVFDLWVPDMGMGM